jgi:hypothetical protein
MAQAVCAHSTRAPDLSRPPEWEIRTLSGRLIAATFVSAISRSPFEWVRTAIAQEFQCDPENVDCFDDDDGFDWLTANGVRVGYVQFSDCGIRSVAPAYAQAAE